MITTKHNLSNTFPMPPVTLKLGRHWNWQENVKITGGYHHAKFGRSWFRPPPPPPHHTQKMFFPQKASWLDRQPHIFTLVWFIMQVKNAHPFMQNTTNRSTNINEAIKQQLYLQASFLVATWAECGMGTASPPCRTMPQNHCSAAAQWTWTSDWLPHTQHAWESSLSSLAPVPLWHCPGCTGLRNWSQGRLVCAHVEVARWQLSCQTSLPN